MSKTTFTVEHRPERAAFHWVVVSSNPTFRTHFFSTEKEAQDFAAKMRLHPWYA